MAKPTLMDEYAPAHRLPDCMDPIGGAPEDILYAMLAARTWDARTFGLCSIGDMRRMAERDGDLPQVIAMATFYRYDPDFTMEYDFAGYNGRDDPWLREETLKRIGQALKDARAMAEPGETVVLVAGPYGDNEDYGGICVPTEEKHEGRWWVRICFPRIIGSVPGRGDGRG